MKSEPRNLGALLWLVMAACGTTGERTAGGQSGTDANGGYDCAFHFDEPAGAQVPLHEPVKSGLSPNDYYARLEGAYVFACDDGVKYSVSVKPGGAARRALGRLNESEPSELCESLQLDAEIHLEAEDGSLTHDAGFLTANLLGSYEIGGTATDTAGRELWLILQEEASRAGSITTLRIDRPRVSTTYCLVAGDEVAAGGGGG